MRPGQNKRMRGRPNNNNGGGHRKGPNPLTRSYESNGPDVKIRGNANHVAEKYLQLARDAQSSGDPVAAESYLQHAEHYFRLIASAQAAQAGYARQPDAVDTEFDDDDDSGVPDRFASPQPAAPPPFVPQPAPQSYGERPPFNGQNGDRQPYGDRQANGERPQFGDRNGYGRQDRNNQDRNNPNRRPYEDRQNPDRANADRQDRPFNDRQSRRERFAQERQERTGQERPFNERGYERQNREGGDRYREAASAEQPRDPYAGEQPRIEPVAERKPDLVAPEPVRQPEQPAAIEAAPQPEPASFPDPRPEPLRRRERPAPAGEDAPGLPSFITTPTRVPAAAEAGVAEPGLAMTTAFPGDDAEGAPKFPRRRRRTTRSTAEGESPAPGAPREPVTGD